MTEREQDNRFKEAAETYLEEYGKQVRLELKELDESGTVFHTPALDARVRRETTGHRRKLLFPGMALMAACLVLFLLVPVLMHPIGNRESEATSPPAAGLEQEGAAEEQPPEETQPTVQFEAIPLSFSPPSNFQVTDWEQDNEKTIYYLSDSYRDNVVITLEAYPGDSTSFEGLTRISIDGSPAYATSTQTYNLLAFERDDILYTMTCQYDINTLVALGAEAI